MYAVYVMYVLHAVHVMYVKYYSDVVKKLQIRIGGNLRNQLVLQICGLQICDSILEHRTALLTSPPARPPPNKGLLQKSSIRGSSVRSALTIHEDTGFQS